MGTQHFYLYRFTCPKFSALWDRPGKHTSRNILLNETYTHIIPIQYGTIKEPVVYVGAPDFACTTLQLLPEIVEKR